MKTLSDKIITSLQSKHDAFLGTRGEAHRQAFKDGLAWAIDTVETLTEVEKCEDESASKALKEYMLEILAIEGTYLISEGFHPVTDALRAEINQDYIDTQNKEIDG